MSTKTTDLWLSRDPDGYYSASMTEPVRKRTGAFPNWFWDAPHIKDVGYPLAALRKGTKRRIRVTVEVLK
jgi:hypothetical protein